MTLPRVAAITGATGVIYGVELLRVLKPLGQPAHRSLGAALDQDGSAQQWFKHWANHVRDDQGRDALRAV
jgi:3-polyprenyl-4-hydroxybenzoate decarboxylase